MMGRLVFYTNPWASGEIRGRQMAFAVDGIVDADKIYSDDVLVFIKGQPPRRIIDYVRKVYVDVDDGWRAIPFLKANPDVVPIAASVVGQRYLSEQLGRGDVLLIPGHHCNFERCIRVTSKVSAVGYIGYPENLHIDIDVLRKALDAIDIHFVAKTDAKSREDVCNFYKSIDIQVCFRKKNEMNPAPELRDPLKLINAGSFGIPTVAYPEPSYADEFDGCFVEVSSLNDIVNQCMQFKNNAWLYHEMSMKAMQRAEQYHIDYISPLFMRLLDES